MIVASMKASRLPWPFSLRMNYANITSGRRSGPLAANPIVRGAWEQSKELTLHGRVYGIGDGRLQTVCPPVINPFIALERP